MIKVEVDIGAIENVKKFCRHYPQALTAALHEKEHGAVDLGQLWNSIHIHRISPTEVIVGTNVEYAAAVEFGTKGHWLTIDKIPGFRGWLRRHGIDLDAKMKYFYVHPKPRPYMEPAYQAGKQIAPDEIKKAVKTATMQVGL